MLKKPNLLTSKEVADQYRKHPVTVRISLNEGFLHGRQRVPGGRWLIEEGCAESWSNGEQCEHLAAVAPEPIELRRMSA